MSTGSRSTFWHFVSAIPLAIAFCSLIVTIIGSHLVAVRDAHEITSRTDEEARHVAAQLRVGLVQAFEPLQRVAAWWLLQGRPLAAEDWENDAQLFVKTSAGLRRLVWLDPRGAYLWSVQPGSHPTLDAAPSPHPALRTALAAARRSTETAMSPVFDAEGTSLIYACAPVRQNGRLMGYIGGLYDAGALIHSLLQNQLPDDYSITVTADGRAFYEPRTQTRPGPTQFERTERVNVASALWSVAVAPSANRFSTLRQPVMGFGVLASILLFICATTARISRRRASELKTANGRLLFENQERQRAEEQVERLNRDLQRKLDEFQTLLDVIPVGIAVAEDPDCRRVWTNRTLAKMVKAQPGENISRSSPEPGTSVHQLIRHGRELAPEELPMQVAARTGAPVENADFDIVRSDGSVLHTLSYAAPLFDEQGNVRGVIDACVDITERKMLEDRLQRAEKYQSLALMAGGIAHDFNNLFTVIMGNAASLVGCVPERSSAGQALADLQNAATKAAELTSHLLAFTGHFWCQVKPIGLSAEIHKMMPALAESAPPSVAIRYELDPGVPLIQAGPAELRQVVESLVANAIEALTDDEPGTIEIRTSRCELSERDIAIFYPDLQLAPGPYVRLEVADTGCGIPDEIVTRVFDPFFTTKFVGRGLGLSAVQGIVRAHGGAIRVSSALHHGARVEVIFPAHVPAAEASSSVAGR